MLRTRIRSLRGVLLGISLLLTTFPALASDIPGLSSRTLDNGLEVIVIENPAVPLVTVEIAVHAGGFVEPPELDGLSHLYEHMFFKGNQALPTQEGFLERMRELGAIWNGTTSEERVNYYFTLPSSRLREGTIFMHDALLKPLFRRDELVRERPVVLGEYDRNEANPGFHLFRENSRLLWGENYSRKNVIGDRTVLATATREQMMLFRENYYIPNNSALLFSGDVDPRDAFELAEELFGSWEPGADPNVQFPIPAHKPLEKSATQAVIQPVQRVNLTIGWHGPGMKADPPATYAADVLSFILSQPNSGWNRRLVESGLFDRINLNYLSQVHTGPISVVAATSADRLDAAYAALEQELEKLTSPDYFTDQELEYSKNQLEYSELRGRQQPSEFVHTVSFWWATGGLDYYRNYIDDLRAVTREDINRYVSRYIQDKPSISSFLVSEEDLARSEILAQAVVVRPESGSSGTAIAAQRDEAAGSTEAFEIAGVPVILRSLPAAPTVSVHAFLKGGLGATEGSDSGLESLLWAVASNQSQKYDKETMAVELTRLGAQFSSLVREDYSRFSLDAIAENFEESLSLYLDALTAPRWTEEELDLARKRQLSALAGNYADPDEIVERMALRAHYGDHPFAQDALGNEELLANVRIADLERKHIEIVTKSRLLLSVAGNVDRESLTQGIESILASIPEGNELPAPPQVEGLDQSTPILEQRDLPTVYVRGLFPAVDPMSPDYGAHLLAHRILSRELWEEIRTKRNLAYAVSANLQRRSFNTGSLYITTAEPNTALPVIKATLERLAETPLSAQDVRDSAETLRTGYLTGMEMPADLAAVLGSYEITSGGWERVEEVIDSLTEVTPQQVQKALQESVRNVDFAILGDLDKVDRTLLDSM